MRKLKSLTLGVLLSLLAVGVLEIGTPHRAHAVQTIYGGIPSPRYVTTSEVIWWQATSVPNVTSAQFIWTYALQCNNGNVNPAGSPYFTDTGSITYNTTTGSGFGKFFPCEGWLIYATVELNNPGSVAVGQLYEQILILNTMPPGGSISTSINVAGAAIEQCLLGVNLNSFYTYSYPATGCQPPTNAPGLNQSLSIGNPAAGANFQQALAATVRHRIINLQFTLTTSATAQNRFACINFLTGGVAGTIVGRACSPYAQIASTTVIYNFGNATGWATNCSLMGATQTAVQCPAITVPMAQYWESTAAFESFAINSAVLTETGANGLAVGDQISSISVREQIWNETD